MRILTYCFPTTAADWCPTATWGKELIEKIPMPNFWRAPIDNDCGSRMQGRMAQWKIASMYAGMSSKGMFDYEEPVVREEKDSVSITYTYLLPTTPQANAA